MGCFVTYLVERCLLEPKQTNKGLANKFTLFLYIRKTEMPIAVKKSGGEIKFLHKMDRNSAFQAGTVSQHCTVETKTTLKTRANRIAKSRINNLIFGTCVTVFAIVVFVVLYSCEKEEQSGGTNSPQTVSSPLIGKSFIHGTAIAEDDEEDTVEKKQKGVGRTIETEGVSLQMWQSGTWQTVAVTVTDDDGRFEFEVSNSDLYVGTYRLVVGNPTEADVNKIPCIEIHNEDDIFIEYIIQENNVRLNLCVNRIR